MLVASVLAGAIAVACSASDIPNDLGAGSSRPPSTSEEPISAANEASACGNGTCDTGETCQSCAQDCGTCTACPLARACKAGMSAPSASTPATWLDVGLEAMPKERILADLAAAAGRGDPRLVVLDRILHADADAPPIFAKLRAVLDAHPRIATALRRQLGRAEIAAPLAKARVKMTASAARVPPRPPAVMDKDKDKDKDKNPPPTPDAGSTAPAADAGQTEGGVPIRCDAPSLRIRAASITTKEIDDDLVGDTIFCTIAAGSTTAPPETRIIPKTPSMSSKQTHSWTQSEGTFWGLTAPKDAKGDLEIRYDCFEIDSPKGYEDFIAAMTEAASAAGATFLPDGYGWVGTAIDLLGYVLPSILALDGDDHLFSAAQMIPRDRQMDLVNGGSWTVRREGTNLWSEWDWTLKIEAYGCSDNGTKP